MNPWNDSEAYAREAAKVESAGEAVLLALLWWRRAGWTVRAQEPIEQYRIDLVIPEAMVSIEVDSFEGHGSGAAMEHDAQKRNRVVAAGWAPLTYSARDALFHSQDTLADILGHVERCMPERMTPSRTPAPRETWDPVAFAAESRALLATLHGGPPDVGALKLSPTHAALADRTALERLGIDLLMIVVDCPVLLSDERVARALRLIDGPVSIGLTALRAATRGGKISVPAFLGECPAIVQPIACRRLAAPRFANETAARAAAAAILDQIGGEA